MSEPVETNLAGLEVMHRMLDALLEMRERIRSLQNEKDLCWNDWAYSYTVDALLTEAGVVEEDSDG